MMCSCASSLAHTCQGNDAACDPCVGFGFCCNYACGGGRDDHDPCEHQRACLCRRQRRREISFACDQSDGDYASGMWTVSEYNGAGSGPCASVEVESDCQMQPKANGLCRGGV